jgi:hypothetical protein
VPEHWVLPVKQVGAADTSEVEALELVDSLVLVVDTRVQAALVAAWVVVAVQERLAELMLVQLVLRVS